MTTERPPPFAAAADATLGARFTYVRELGVGGMGRVLEVYDERLERTAAIKMLQESAVTDRARVGRFLAEARITAQLEHPNVVPLHDMIQTDTGLMIVMRNVVGDSLRAVLDELGRAESGTASKWTRHRLLGAFLKVCHAVAYAHDRGILHRDLKPDNVMLGPYGDVLVMDWGVATRMGDEEEVVVEQMSAKITRVQTQAGAFIGTPGYMSPEQICGNLFKLDGRSDLWSLGAILYEILTLVPAYRGEPYAMLARTLQGPPASPQKIAPALGVPDEIAQVCMKALAPEPADRFRTALELAEAVEAFLEGSKQKEAARRQMEGAEAIWSRYLELESRREELEVQEKRLADAADAWAPITERSELLAVRDELAELGPRRAKLFSELIGHCEKALAHDPGDPTARRVLARAYWGRLLDAERRRDAAEVVYLTDRVAAHDDGHYVELLQGRGTLTLRTDPPGAEAILERYEQRGLVHRLVDATPLGKTPLVRVPLAMGSYRVTLRADGKRDTLYPVFIPRCHPWDSGAQPIPLHDESTIGEGFVYVPPGPFIYGGDREAPGSKPRQEIWVDGFFIARVPVTMAEYLDFLNALHERDPAEAWRRAPRSEAGLSETEGQYFERPRDGEGYRLPETDREGNRWDPRWPVFGVSWTDAAAYARFASERDGRRFDLPREVELEKAARGVDGRFYPWGDGFDRTLCKMADSRRGRALPEAVGSFPTDVSPYGVRDLAGSMRDWCGDPEFDGDSTQRPVRGGSWNYDPRFCRAACRLGRPPWRVFSYNGFRLVHR